MPAIIPGAISGNVTNTNTPNRLAPSVPAASSRRRSTASIESRIARTIRGNPMTAHASAAPVQRNENTMPNCSARNETDQPAPTKGQQQQISGYDRRQDEEAEARSRRRTICREICTRQQISDRNPDRQAR